MLLISHNFTGNMLRFPFSALKNGGGAYVIPYFIVLFVVGKPIYLLEMVLGQFYSRGCIKAFDFAPALRGTKILLFHLILQFSLKTFPPLRCRSGSSDFHIHSSYFLRCFDEHQFEIFHRFILNQSALEWVWSEMECFMHFFE